jgi:hypothetical protein
MNELPRDSELERALRPVEGDASLSEVDWERLRASIASRSIFALARLRRGGTWWEFTARWGRIAVPIAAAAGIVLASLLPRSLGPGDATGDASVDRAGLAMVVSGEATEGAVVQAAIAGPDERWLEDKILGDR